MTLVIAEAGVNHSGRLDHALALVHAAKAAGADAVKFQAFCPERLAPGDYARRAMLKGLALTRAELTMLAAEARHQGIEFMCTPMDEEWLEFVVGLGVRRIKIGSAQAGDEKFVRACAETGLPLIISNGMTSPEVFHRAVSEWCSRDVTAMYCVSKYPTSQSDVDLSEIRRLKREMAEIETTKPRVFTVGFSSHCPLRYPAVAAVYAGATVIEAHLKLSGHDIGPDMSSSLLPEEFGKMVQEIRKAENA